MYKVWRTPTGEPVGYCDEGYQDFLPAGEGLIVTMEATTPAFSMVDRTATLTTTTAYLEAPDIPQWFKDWLSTCYVDASQINSLKS